MITIPDALRRPAEVERDELKRQLAEIEEREAACCPEDVPFDEYIMALGEQLAGARTEIERLKEYTTCTLESADANIDDKDVEIIKRDKLIEQMRKALSNADDLIDEYAADYEHRDNVDEIRDEIKAALSAAERAEE